MRLAESVHELESLTVYYHHLLDALQEFGDNGRADHRGDGSKSCCSACRSSHIVRSMWSSACSWAPGRAQSWRRIPMQRYWRDAHAVRLHTGSDYDVSKLHHGRNLLGLMPTPDL